MKFKSLLIERQLEKENLSVKLQKKIEQLERIEKQLEEMEAVAKDPDENEAIAIAKVRLSSLDDELVKLLKKFDPELYQIQKEKMAKINEIKYGAIDEVDEEPKTEQEELAEQQEQEVFEEESVLEQIPPISKTLHIKEDLEKLKEEVEIEPDSLEDDRAPLESVIEPEIEEFDKHEATKPKKMSKGLILMGVGAFLLTWGAVNFFRDRRGG